jgi:hypothetical protein
VVTGWDYPRAAEKLRDYFARQESGRDERGAIDALEAARGEEWVDGFLAAECWLACQNEGADAARLSECDDLIAVGGKYGGSGWVELQMAYATWRSLGRF